MSTPNTPNTPNNSGAPAAAAPGAANPTASVLSTAGANDLEWMPVKFRTSKADGSFDLDGSSRKLAGSYLELEKNRGRNAGAGARPETADAYALPETVKLPEGVTLETLRADPLGAKWLQDAHAQGFTNEQLGLAMQGFFGFLERDGELSAKEATADLRKTWASDADYQAHLRSAARAVATLAQKAGLDAAELDRLYGNETSFIRLMAAIGAEMKEDTAPNPQGFGQAGGFDEQVAELANEIDALPQHDLKRARLLQDYHSLFRRRFPGKAGDGSGT